MEALTQNKFLTAFIAIVVVIGAVLGFFLFKAWGAYKDSYAQFGTARDAVAALERSKPYPSEENLAAKQKSVADYRATVATLHADLAKFQQPLVQMTDLEFQGRLKKEVEAINVAAAKAEIELPEGFSLSMGKYISTAPQPKAVGLLSYQLDSLSFLANTILASPGLKQVESFTRTVLPIESGRAPEKEGENAAPILRRYPVTFVVAGGQEAIESLLQKLSNTAHSELFHVVRLLRIENEDKSGPPRGASSAFVDPGVDDDFRVFDDLSEGTSLESAPDAEFVLGEQLVKAYFKVELIRFREPEAKEEEGAPKKDGDSAKAASNILTDPAIALGV